MKKICLIILLFLSNNLFAQNSVRWWFTPKQDETIDSLREAIDSLGTVGLPPLSYGRLWIGDAAGYPASRTLSGDVTVDYLGVTTIGNLKITNAKVATGIDAVKLGNGTITNAEFQTLNGINTAKTIQQQIDDIEVGTGFTLNGPETNLEIAWNVGEGNEYGILFGEDNQVNFPTLTTISNLDPGKYGIKGDSAYIGTNHGLEKFMFRSDVQEMIDSNYTYNQPATISNGDVLINFTNDRNFIKAIVSVASDNNLDVSFANSGYGSVTIWVIGGWNPSGTINWNTSIAGETLMWVGGVEPPLDTSTSNQLFIINFTKGTSTIIVGQWNYAE